MPSHRHREPQERRRQQKESTEAIGQNVHFFVAVDQDIHHMSAAQEGTAAKLSHQVVSVAPDAKEEAVVAQETEETEEAEMWEAEKSEHTKCTLDDSSTILSLPLAPSRVPSLCPEQLPAPLALPARCRCLAAR